MNRTAASGQGAGPAGGAAAASGGIAIFEGLLVALLARPMFAFLLVVAGFGSGKKHTGQPS